LRVEDEKWERWKAAAEKRNISIAAFVISCVEDALKR
jgi:predicted HicB family RNase H-like nuclease